MQIKRNKKTLKIIFEVDISKLAMPEESTEASFSPPSLNWVLAETYFVFL